MTEIQVARLLALLFMFLTGFCVESYFKDTNAGVVGLLCILLTAYSAGYHMYDWINQD